MVINLFIQGIVTLYTNLYNLSFVTLTMSLQSLLIGIFIVILTYVFLIKEEETFKKKDD